MWLERFSDASVTSNVKHSSPASEFRWLSRELNQPHPPLLDAFTASTSVHMQRPAKRFFQDTIFVSIASFRDNECADSVKNMYEMALEPRRLFVGIVEQHSHDDRTCLPSAFLEGHSRLSFSPSDNVRIRRISPREAKGPTFGRWVAMLMYRDEKYFMMIDSHNRFSTHWEETLVRMYGSLPSKKGVLSHYPAAFVNGTSQHDMDHSTVTTVMCNAHFIDSGYLRLDGTVMSASAMPRVQPFAAAGFLFANGSLVREVPFDPYLDFLFDGEEILYSARMWTHGWNIYAPSKNILYHFYGRSKAERVWSVKGNRWAFHQAISVQRVQHLLQVTWKNSTKLIVPAGMKTDPRVMREIHKYGLGGVRSLSDYWIFAKVDPTSRTADSAFCRGLTDQNNHR